MQYAHPVLIPSWPFAGLSTVAGAGSGVIVTGRDGVALATVRARKDRSTALARRVHELFRIDLPQGPHRRTAGDVGFAGTGPGAWLAMRDQGGHAFAASLKEAIGDVASVADQSDAYAVLRLFGPKIRETFAKLFSIDFHPKVFKPGDVSVTMAAHIGATLWRLENDIENDPAFEIAVSRSLAASFWHVLAESAAEFGVRIADS